MYISLYLRNIHNSLCAFFEVTAISLHEKIWSVWQGGTTLFTVQTAFTLSFSFTHLLPSGVLFHWIWRDLAWVICWFGHFKAHRWQSSNVHISPSVPQEHVLFDYFFCKACLPLGRHPCILSSQFFLHAKWINYIPLRCVLNLAWWKFLLILRTCKPYVKEGI